jgi:hypothetical protein
LDDYVGIKLYEPTGVLTGDCKFDVTVNAPVVPDAVAIMERFTHLDLRQSVARTIFDGYAPYTQRLYELQRIWQYSPEMLLRMGAFVLAFGYQLERLRLGIGMPASRSTLRQVT